MSLILDALRKSEQERRQVDAALPTLATETVPLPRRHSYPLAMVAVFVLAAALASGYWVFSGGRESAPLPALGSASPPVEVSKAATVAGEKSQAPPLTVNPFVETKRQAGAVRDLASEARAPRPAPAPERPAATSSGQPLALAAPSPEATPAPGDTAVKFLRAMPLEFQRALPELVVNIHIYAPRAADRILYINNRQYQAGDKVREDIVVEEIVEDGAVLSYRGQRFKLPRPS